MPLTKAVLQKYLNEVFIETGTYLGEGVQLAVEVGFREIYTCELDTTIFQAYKGPFHSWINRHISTSPSFLKFLHNIRVQRTITYWLDAHYIDARFITPNPLLEELQIIFPTLKEKDIVLIDDMRCAGNGNFPSKEEIISHLFGFSFSYEDGYNPHSNETYKQDIMVIKKIV